MVNGVEVGSQKIAEGSEIIIRNEEVTILRITKGQSLPTTYNLEQNYPNPFNPSTTIKFQIPNKALVTLKIFDVLGNEVGVLVNREMDTGNYEVEFDAIEIPSGIYFYRLHTDSFIETKKMMLIK
jgi:hypothetical protein